MADASNLTQGVQTYIEKTLYVRSPKNYYKSLIIFFDH